MSQRKSTIRSPNKARPKTSSISYAQFEPDLVVQEQLHACQMTISNQEIEIERLKTTVIALNAKCSIVDDHRLDVEQHFDRHSKSETQRVGLHGTIQEVREQVSVQQVAHQNYQQQLHSDIGDLNSNLEQQKQHQHQREQDHRNDKETMSQNHYNTVQQLNDELTRRTNEHNAIHEQTRSSLTQERESLRLHLTTKHVEMEQRLNAENERIRFEHQAENETTRARLQAESQRQRDELQKKLDDQEAHYNTLLTQTKNKMAADHENTRRTLTDHNERERAQLTKDNEDIRLSLTSQMESQRRYHIDDHEKTRSTLSQQMEFMRAEKDSRHGELEDMHENLRLTTTEQITQHELTINEITDHKMDHANTIIAHEQTIHHQRDVHDQHLTSQQQIEQLLSQKDTLQEELNNSADYILELEEKVYKANKTSLELLKQLKDAEVEIETLKQYIIDLKQRIAVYIPVKADSTDKKLAEFINNYPERSKLKIMFMRETEGVYQFGTKKVAVKVEKDNIKIRVGGGYLSIDEFLDQYTPVELEKLERKDPLRRFSEKVAIQKTIVGQAVRESSPVRTSSPVGNRGSPGRYAV